MNYLKQKCVVCIFFSNGVFVIIWCDVYGTQVKFFILTTPQSFFFFFFFSLSSQTIPSKLISKGIEYEIQHHNHYYEDVLFYLSTNTFTSCTILQHSFLISDNLCSIFVKLLLILLCLINGGEPLECFFTHPTNITLISDQMPPYICRIEITVSNTPQHNQM